jgi:hypothetical protein
MRSVVAYSFYCNYYIVLFVLFVLIVNINDLFFNFVIVPFFSSDNNPTAHS